MYNEIIDKTNTLTDGVDRLQDMINTELRKLDEDPKYNSSVKHRMLYQAMMEASDLAVEARNKLLRVSFNVSGVARVLSEEKKEC